jgi:hypothetical protein
VSIVGCGEEAVAGRAREGGGVAHYATFPTFPYGLHLLRDICSTTSIHKRMIPPRGFPPGT